MKPRSILIASNLKVWSLAKGSGAPSFYKTLQLYDQKDFTVFLYSTESENPVPELPNVKHVKLPRLSITQKRYLCSIKRAINYFVYQIIFLYVFLKNDHTPDLFYAYEIEFVPALKILSFLKKVPFVTRFQGTILYPLMQKKFWRWRFLPHYLSLKLPSDLTIMTNDGTKGDIVLSCIRGRNYGNVLFAFNGTTPESFYMDKISDHIKQLEFSTQMFKFICVSRLEKWKRVDRSIEVFEYFFKIIPNSRLLIVGDGNCYEELRQLVEEKKLSTSVIFLGSVNRDEVDFLLFNSDIFLSHYALSNVGNPLWEALRRECVVTTIDNGDTGKIIKDGVNGIISPEELFLENGKKLVSYCKSGEYGEICRMGRKTYNEMTVTWTERMELEYDRVMNIMKPVL